MQNKLPIVLIHGFPLDAEMWRPQIAPLAAQMRDVHAIDLPGFGHSKTAAADSIDAMAASVHEKISALGGRAIVAGLSMGGYVLFALLRHYSAVVAGAIFVDTRADADSPEAKQNRANSIAEIKQNGPAKVYENLLKRLVAPQAGDKVKAELRHMMERQNPQSVIAAQEAMMNRRDQTDLLGEIKVPALFIVGRHDVITPPAVAQAMHEKAPGSMLFEIENAGHMANLENPAAVNGAIEKFLASFPP